MYSSSLTLPDPIHEENGQFYFWDETWSDRHGPFKTKNEATQRLGQYILQLENGYEFSEESEKRSRDLDKAFRKAFLASLFRNTCYFAILLTVFYICFIYKDQLFEFKDSLLQMFQQSFYFFRDWFMDGKNAVRKFLMEAL